MFFFSLRFVVAFSPSGCALMSFWISAQVFLSPIKRLIDASTKTNLRLKLISLLLHLCKPIRFWIIHTYREDVFSQFTTNIITAGSSSSSSWKGIWFEIKTLLAYFSHPFFIPFKYKSTLLVGFEIKNGNEMKCNSLARGFSLLQRTKTTTSIQDATRGLEWLNPVRPSMEHWCRKAKFKLSYMDLDRTVYRWSVYLQDNCAQIFGVEIAIIGEYLLFTSFATSFAPRSYHAQQTVTFLLAFKPFTNNKAKTIIFLATSSHSQGLLQEQAKCGVDLWVVNVWSAQGDSNHSAT